MLAQSAYFGFRIGEISCPTRYIPEASSINFKRSVVYGMGVVRTSLQYRAQRLRLINSPLSRCREKDDCQSLMKPILIGCSLKVGVR